MDWLYAALHHPSEATIAVMAFLIGLGFMIARRVG